MKPYGLLEVSSTWRQSGDIVERKVLEQTRPKRQAHPSISFRRESLGRNLVFRDSHGHFQHVKGNIISSSGKNDTLTALWVLLLYVFAPQLDGSTNTASLFTSYSLATY
jgi:hypothetical protein